MAWHRIDPRYLRQEGAAGLTLGYASHGGRDTGHLLPYLDSQGNLARFELAYERFLRSPDGGNWLGPSMSVDNVVADAL